MIAMIGLICCGLLCTWAWHRTTATFPIFRRLLDRCEHADLSSYRQRREQASENASEPARPPVYAITGASGFIGARFVEHLLAAWSNPHQRLGPAVPPEGELRLLCRPSTLNRLAMSQLKARYPRSHLTVIWGPGESPESIKALLCGPICMVRCST